MLDIWGLSSFSLSGLAKTCVFKEEILLVNPKSKFSVHHLETLKLFVKPYRKTKSTT